MFRLWAKIFKDNRLLRDHTIEDSSDSTRTTKVLKAVEDTCVLFDLSIPLWLDTNIREFQKHAKTRFNQDSFIETIDFDYLEIHVIEEDY